MGEIAKAVDLLHAIHLTTGHHVESLSPADVDTDLHVSCTIVIGDGYDLQTFLFRATDDVSRTHLQIPAGGETSVNMQIGVIPVHFISGLDYEQLAISGKR